MADDSPVELLPLGAIIQTLRVAGQNIVQSLPSTEAYQAHNAPYFGETIGRVANRISNATLSSLNGGQSYKLTANDGTNNLHGGVAGWGKKIWAGPEPVGVRKIPGLEGLEGGESVKFSLVSEDGDEGFPGKVEVSCVYTAGVQRVEGKEVTVLGMEYEAELVDEKVQETVINMTNHSYFNLSGAPTIAGTVVALESGTYVPLDAAGIPNAAPTAYPGVTASTPFTLGPAEPDMDDSFVVDPSASPSATGIDTRSNPLKRHVAAHHPDTGIHLEVLSTEPFFHFYTGRYIDVPAVEGVPARGKRSGFCVEPGRFVNAINTEEYKHSVVLKKGEKYGSRIVYRAWKE